MLLLGLELRVEDFSTVNYLVSHLGKEQGTGKREQ
jgi:hypothetical protein